MLAPNVVLGYQSEYSLALSDTRFTGSRFNTQTQVTGATTFTNSFTSFDERNLKNTWTASALARLGVLVTPDTQLYGLAGWSWGGFVLDDGSPQSVVLNGPTVGVGVERDFGWLRGFIQGKAIFYDTESLNIPQNQVQTFTQTVPGTTVTQTFTSTGNERRKVSADVFTFTGGVVVPLDIR